MGSNFYLYTNFCPTCGHPRKVYHIGKNSWGWVFHFQEIHGFHVPVTNLEDMKTFTKQGIIKDEYDNEVSYDEFWEMVEETKEPIWATQAINYTSKTQYIYRIRITCSASS